EFRAIENSRDKANLTRAASKINENLYASTALERGTLKVKSMQSGRGKRGRLQFLVTPESLRTAMMEQALEKGQQLNVLELAQL
ncbi:DUF1454 family protein, partial [Salmonella enterica subsp. enterica serovar Anatum]|nr:DUF1454 family protein [Salmonella enterica subsp. enterica serovar Anatum]